LNLKPEILYPLTLSPEPKTLHLKHLTQNQKPVTLNL